MVYLETTNLMKNCIVASEYQYRNVFLGTLFIITHDGLILSVLTQEVLVTHALPEYRSVCKNFKYIYGFNNCRSQIKAKLHSW